jgi:aconitate hydratase 2/2-methylisocitrate dehydratase
MDKHVLTEEGYYSIYGRSGARIEIPGCSLCMGNQARVRDNATVVSTSTRNFPNRLGTGANVYLASAEVAAVSSVLGHLPSVAEYMEHVKGLAPAVEEVYRCSRFDQIDEYRKAENITPKEC